MYASDEQKRDGHVRRCFSRTFTRWLSAYKEDLLKLGVTPKTRLLPPKAVMFLSEMLGIDVDT